MIVFLQIVYESPGVMLVNKPPGVPAHATVDNFGENMLAGIRRGEARWDEFSGRGFAAQIGVFSSFYCLGMRL